MQQKGKFWRKKPKIRQTNVKEAAEYDRFDEELNMMMMINLFIKDKKP